MKNNIPFAKIYNVLLDEEYKLNEKELYFYALLSSKYIPFYGYAETNLTMINESQRVYKSKDNERKNIANVKKMITNLHDKGIINISCLDEKFDKNSTLNITFPKLGEGFYPLTLNTLQKLKCEKELLVVTWIGRWQGKPFSKSREGWMDIIHSKKKDTCDLLNQMIENQIIRCVESKPKRDSNGQWTQGNTLWYIVEEEKVQEAEEEIIIPDDIVPDVQPETKEESKQDEQVEAAEDEDYIEETREHNWYVNKSTLTAQDFYILFTTEDQKLTEKAEKRIESISKNEKGAYAIECLKAEAENILEQEMYKAKKEKENMAKGEMLQKFQDMKGAGVWLHDGKLVDLGTYQASPNEIGEIGYFKSNYRTDYSGGMIEDETEIVSVKWQQILDGDGSSYIKVSPEITKKMKQRLIEIGSTKQIDASDISELRDYVKQLCDEANEGRDIDEEWEGDEFCSFTNGIEANESMQRRKQRERNKENNKKNSHLVEMFEHEDKKERERKKRVNENIEELFG